MRIPATAAGLNLLIGIIENLTEGVILTDDKGIIDWSNPAAREFFDYSPGEMKGKNIRSLFITPVMDFWDSALNLKPEEEILASKLQEVRGITRNGSFLPIGIKNVPLNAQGLRGFALIFQDHSERDKAEQTIKHLSHYDALTGLPNRELFLDRAEKALDKSQRNQDLLALQLIDLDNFNVINESFGPDLGDQLLGHIAQRISHYFGEENALARLGGDKFGLIFPNIENNEIVPLGAKIQEIFKQPFTCLDKKMVITTSSGIALFPNDGANAQVLMKNAETAMYQAKRLGKNNYCFFDPKLGKQAASRFEMEGWIRKGLAEGEFEVFYQPKIDFNTGLLKGVEALLRWKHPEMGWVPPGTFIPIAEETGLIKEIGQWVLKQACAQNKLWQSMGFQDIKVAVNLSVCQFGQEDLVRQISGALDDAGMESRHLELELTESAFLEDLEKGLAVLKQLRNMGISVSIDDFGTGYSSLSYIKNIAPEVVKIDQSFVGDMDNQANQAIIQAVIAIAQSLGMETVAEGVETQEQHQTLKDLGCDTFQGYFYSPAISAERVTQMLTEEQKLN